MSPRLLSMPAELTYLRLRGILPNFVAASQRHRVSLGLLLAIASRESRMGLALSADGTGDNGHGIGIMQIDRRYHPGFTGSHSPFDHQANINYGAGYLAKLLREFNDNKHQAASAYNAGPGRVRSALQQGLDPNLVTTGGDYGRDVLERMQYINKAMSYTTATALSVYLIPFALIGFATYNYLKHAQQ